jgi:hypothetical protein
MTVAAGTSVIIQETSFGGITSETFNPFRPVEVGRSVTGGVETKYVLTSADADGKLPYAV